MFVKKLIVFLLILVTPVICFAGTSNALDSYQTFDTKIFVNGSLIQPERDYVLIKNRILVPGRTTFDALGMTVNWDEGRKIVEIYKDGDKLTMTIGSRVSYMNGRRDIMDIYPVIVRGTVMVPLRFVSEAFGNFVSWDSATSSVKVNEANYQSNGSDNLNNSQNQSTSKDITEDTTDISSVSRGDEQKKRTVVVDAGHGGSDPGAVFGGINEKDLNLDIAIRLQKLLINEGITVIMTRTNDKYVSLYDRARIANNVNADLFISVHNNAVSNSSISGSMSLYYPTTKDTKDNMNGQKLAVLVQDKLTEILKTKDYGEIPRKNLVVLRETKMPAIIAEIGFMTNQRELSLLSQSSYRQKAANALFEGVVATLDKMQ